MDCDHPSGVVVSTFWIMHVFCEDCRTYITSAIDQEINMRTAQRTHDHRRRSVTVDGVTKTIKEWAIHSNLTPSAIQQRLSNGWSHKDAVMRPHRNSRISRGDNV